MLTIMGKGRLNRTGGGECYRRASWKHHLSWVSEDPVGIDRQIRYRVCHCCCCCCLFSVFRLRGELKQT